MAVVILCISLGIFAVLDVVKVLVFKYWSFELTTILWPTPKRRRKLETKRREHENYEKNRINFLKLKKVLFMLKVIKAFNNEVDEKNREDNRNNEDNSEGNNEGNNERNNEDNSEGNNEGNSEGYNEDNSEGNNEGNSEGYNEEINEKQNR